MNVFLALMFAFSSCFVFAQTAEVITIGCTTKCSFFYKNALKRVSTLTGIPVSIVDLSISQLPLERLDGIVIPGGADINPDYYLPFVEKDLQEYTRNLDHLINYSEEGRRRDPIEFSLLKKYFADEGSRDLPILGICRGMQMLAVSQGIPLYVDIKRELGIRNRRYIYDRILVKDEESLMRNLFPTISFLGFKQHHQGIRMNYYLKHMNRWPKVKITSYSNRNLIAESMEFKDRPVLGVQFHPEKDFGHERKSIFRWLLTKAQSRRNKKHGIKSL